MDTERSARIIIRVIGLLAILVGVLSLLGVKPMNSRVVEVTLGSASLVAGLGLLVVSAVAARQSRRVDPA